MELFNLKVDSHIRFKGEVDCNIKVASHIRFKGHVLFYCLSNENIDRLDGILNEIGLLCTAS